MSRFINRALRPLKPYVPGEQPQEEGLIKLNTNESPFPPSPAAVAAAAAEAEKLQLYSDPECGVFLDALAEWFGVGRGRVFASNGSDEVLAMVFLSMCENGAAFADITYGFYSVYAGLFGVDARVIPLKEDFSLDPADYFGAGRTVLIANPNAPTGLALPREAIREILEANRDSLVVIDEAYVDFGAESALPLLADYGNLLIIGTFSKSRSMAGARLGYAVGSEELIAGLNRVKFSFNPYNVNRMTLAAGAAALRDRAYFEQCRDAVIRNREETQKALCALGFRCTNSKANFLFLCHPSLPGEEVYRRLREKGILVRWFNQERIRDWLRVTVGSEEEMRALIREIGKIGR